MAQKALGLAPEATWKTSTGVEEGDKGGMSGWLDGSGFDKLSRLAETAAQTAAAAKADAEARLIASLNADAPQSPSGTPDRAAVARPEGEASGLDFSTLPRKDLEELCTKRSEKLKQAVQKIRAQQEEYMRVQRDYEQLQQIVRADSTGAGGTGDDAQQLRIDLQAAQDRSEALRKDKAELQRENEGLTTSLASTKEKLEKVKIKSQELLSKFKTQMAEKDETQKGLEDRIQQLLQQLPHAESSKQPKQEAGQATCCASLRAELESTQKKLEQANISASAFEAKGKDELRRLQDDSAAAIEAADRRAVEQLERAQAEHLEVLQLRQQLEQAIPQQRDELGACSACEQMAGELRSLETARAAADEALLMLQKSSQQKQDDLARKLESQRARADEAVARVEEELAACQNQVAEWQTRARELEEAAQQEAEGAEAGRGRVKELQEALESCRKELDACKTEHEAVQAQHVVEVESLRAEVSDRNATLEACREEIAVLKSKHDMELEELKQSDKKIKEKAKVVIEQAKTKAKQAEEEKREALEAVQQLERERDALQQQHSVLQQQHLALENQEVAAASSAGADPVAEMEQMRHELNLAHEQLRAKEEQTRTIQAEQIKVQHELHEAQKRADDSVNAAAVAQEELLGKISDLNDKCARFYQDREDARDVLADAQAAGSVYKKALLTVTGALKSPVMLGREMNFSREASRLKQVFAEAADSSTHLKDAEGMLVVLAVEELELAVVEALEFAASRSNAWQEARRALEGDVSKGEKRCRQLQDKLDAKNKEVINLMEALKTAEHNESATAGKGEGKGRTPRIDGKCFPPVLHRVWADGTAWALLGGVGEDGEADWYCESSIRAAFTGAEGVSGGEEVLERVGTPWLLEELPLRERKLAELTAALEKKQNELVAIQEEYRAYKIKAHSVLRKKEASAPVRDEDAEAARRRAEIQEAVDNQRAKMAAQIKDADERAASARQDVDVLEGRLKEAGDKIKEQEHRMQVLQEKVCSLEEELCSAAQREREWDQEKLERERKWKQEQEELGIELERGRKKEGVNEEEKAVEDRGQTGHTILVLQRRVASLEQEVETAKEEAKSVSQALEASKEKAQAMLIEKDAVIASLRTRLKSVGMTTGEAGHGVADAVDGLDAVGSQFSLVLQSDNTFILGNEDNSDGKGTARHLHFAPLERAGLDRRPSTETQEEHILHVAQMQAQQSEYVASLLEKISILKDNVSEGKRLQDLLCRERDQLRDALEVMKREVTSTQRLERYNSKFREGTNIEYLKNVLLKFIETQDDKLIPVLSSVLEFDSNEQRRLKDAQTRLSSPWSKIGKGLGGALF